VLIVVYAEMEDLVSSMETATWPSCVADNEPHRPASLILAQIIPANGTKGGVGGWGGGGGEERSEGGRERALQEVR
jgi:hypothetical protein